MSRIKVTNETNHTHAVRLIMPNGNYMHKVLKNRPNKPKLSTPVTEDQFIDLYTTTRDFRDGFLSFNEADLSDDLKMSLGMPVTEEEKKEVEPEFKVYKDEEIAKLFKSKAKNADEKIDAFLEDIKSRDENTSGELKRRLFNVAKDIKNLSRERAEMIEDVTGISFKVDAQNEKENKAK